MGLKVETGRGRPAGNFADIPVYVSELVEEGKLLQARDFGAAVEKEPRGPMVIYAGPLTAWVLAHNGRYPFETQYCRGLSELRRERRLRNRERAQ